MRPRRPFTLVSNGSSDDMLACAERIAEKVRSGKLIGLAYLEIERGRNYSVNLCGEAHRSPAFTRGALGVLIDKLGRLQRGESD